MNPYKNKFIPAAAAAAFISAAASGQAFAKSAETAIYSFTAGNDGGFPHAGVIADTKGNLYGTTDSDGAGHSGVVFEVSPPASGQTAWTETPIYTFTGGADGATPYGQLLMGSKGELYGTTYAGGGSSGDGVVFKLTPPAKGKTAWTQTVLWSFTGGNDGGEPTGALITDSAGNLYGTTTIGGTGVVGTVYELSPPTAGKTAWTQTILYAFTGNNDGGEPFGNVVFGPDGNLYGTSAGYGKYNYGTLYRLTPANHAGRAWHFHLLHAFRGGLDGSTPRDGMIMDATGTLYGTTAGFDNSKGTVFQLTPPATGQSEWRETVLTEFGGQGFTGNGPWAGVTQDSTGALYGTTLGVGASSSGEVFKLTPPATGSTKWTRTILHVFQDNAGSQFPYSTVLIGAGGTLFGTTEGSAGQSGFYPGNVWEITQ